jgi:hypothetical protein
MLLFLLSDYRTGCEIDAAELRKIDSVLDKLDHQAIEDAFANA